MADAASGAAISIFQDTSVSITNAINSAVVGLQDKYAADLVTIAASGMSI